MSEYCHVTGRSCNRCTLSCNRLHYACTSLVHLLVAMMYFRIDPIKEDGRKFVSHFVTDLKNKQGCESVIIDHHQQRRRRHEEQHTGSVLTICPYYHSELGFRLYETYMLKKKFLTTFKYAGSLRLVELIPIYFQKDHDEEEDEEDINILLREVDLFRNEYCNEY